jgi:hypothetical protein
VAFAKAVMWLSIIDTFYCVLLGLLNLYLLPYLMLIPFAIVGFYSGRDLNVKYCSVYLLFQLIKILANIAIMILF